MNEHIRRVHDGFGLSVEDFEKLRGATEEKRAHRATEEQQTWNK